MSANQEQVLKTIQGLGLTRLDSQIYIYLSKKGPKKGLEIAKGLKTQKQTMYRSLKALQSKGIVTATLEHPARFSAVSFGIVIDLFAKAKMAEAQHIQESKGELLASWQAITVGETSDPSARFSVLEGRGYINSKILQMAKETKNRFSTISTVKRLLRADQFGLFDTACSHPSGIQLRFLTQLSKQDIHLIKDLLKGFERMKINIEGRTPDLSPNIFPEMVIKDEDETIFFISPAPTTPTIEESEICLWTNCKSLVQAMTTVFDDLWQNSTEIQRKITEIETGKTLPKTYLFTDAEKAFKKYKETTGEAKEEITITTSSQGLNDILKNKQIMNEWIRKEISVRIMTPIIGDNLSSVRELLKSFQIKHVPVGYLDTTIVDGKELFQFKNAPPSNEQRSFGYFESTFYSNDREYVEKTKKMLDYVWKNAQPPPAITFDSPTEPFSTGTDILPENYPTRRIVGSNIIEVKRLTEKEVLDKIIHAKKLRMRKLDDANRIYATAASAIIHPPDYLNLPNLMLEPLHVEDQSSLGRGDSLTVYQWLNTQRGFGYVPVIIIITTEKPIPAVKLMCTGTPAEDNIRLVKEDELQIRIHGNTMFVGWAVPLPLYTSKCVLPPACLTIEGYGRGNPVCYTTISDAGVKTVVEKNYFEAFVTFMHPRSKYSGPGTDGFFCRDYISTTYLPGTIVKNGSNRD